MSLGRVDCGAPSQEHPPYNLGQGLPLLLGHLAEGSEELVEVYLHGACRVSTWSMLPSINGLLRLSWTSAALDDIGRCLHPRVDCLHLHFWCWQWQWHGTQVPHL